MCDYCGGVLIEIGGELVCINCFDLDELEMYKLNAIKKLADGLKVRRKPWRPKTKHVFMEENGNTYLAQKLNDPHAQEINLNCEPEGEWEVWNEVKKPRPPGANR